MSCIHLFNEIGDNALDLVTINVLLPKKHHGSLKRSERELVGTLQQVSIATGAGKGGGAHLVASTYICKPVLHFLEEISVGYDLQFL